MRVQKCYTTLSTALLTKRKYVSKEKNITSHINYQFKLFLSIIIIILHIKEVSGMKTESS